MAEQNPDAIALIEPRSDRQVTWAEFDQWVDRVAQTLLGRGMMAGQRVGLFYASANHDEDVFTDAHAFDITRDPNPHLAFGGHGAHYCIGANLARTEIRMIFEALADLAPTIAARLGTVIAGADGVPAGDLLPAAWPTARRSRYLARNEMPDDRDRWCSQEKLRGCGFHRSRGSQSER